MFAHVSNLIEFTFSIFALPAFLFQVGFSGSMVRVTLPVGTGGGANNSPLPTPRTTIKARALLRGEVYVRLKACYSPQRSHYHSLGCCKAHSSTSAILVLADLLPSIPFCSIHQTLLTLDVSVHPRNPDHHRHCMLLFIPSSLFHHLHHLHLPRLPHLPHSPSPGLFLFLLSSDSHRRSFAHPRPSWIPSTVLIK